MLLRQAFFEAELDALLKVSETDHFVHSTDLPSVITALQDQTASFGINVDSDTPLMLSGMDSSDCHAFVKHLSNSFKINLPGTLILEDSTIRSIAARIANQGE